MIAESWWITKGHNWMGLPCINIFVILRFDESLNDFSHNKHLNGFSTVWALACCLRCADWQKNFSHIEKLNSFSPEWTLECRLRSDELLKDFSHIEQPKLPCMNSCVQPEMWWINKGLNAKWASEQFLPCMNSWVLQKIWWITKRLIT